MKKYKLFATAYRGGKVRDSGIHDEREFPNDETAVSTFKSEIQNEPICTVNEKVDCVVMCEEVVVRRFTI